MSVRLFSSEASEHIFLFCIFVLMIDTIKVCLGMTRQRRAGFFFFYDDVKCNTPHISVPYNTEVSEYGQDLYCAQLSFIYFKRNTNTNPFFCRFTAPFLTSLNEVKTVLCLCMLWRSILL